MDFNIGVNKLADFFNLPTEEVIKSLDEFSYGQDKQELLNEMLTQYNLKNEF